jgi:cell filamentation protein
MSREDSDGAHFKGGERILLSRAHRTRDAETFADLARQRHFRELDAPTFARKAAHFLAESNAVHPFREGNGTELSFLVALVEHAGHPLALERLDPSAMLNATIVSFRGDEGPLASLIGKLVP